MDNKELVERIRAIAEERGTSLTKIEVALGLGNGAIGKWAKAKKRVSVDRIIQVADVLGVSIRDLGVGADRQHQVEWLSSLRDKQRVLFEHTGDFSDEEMDKAIEMIDMIRGWRDDS